MRAVQRLYCWLNMEAKVNWFRMSGIIKENPSEEVV